MLMSAMMMAAILVPGAVAATPVAAPLMSVTIKGHAMTEAGPGNVDVTMVVPEVDAPAGKPFLKLGLQVPGMAHAQPVTDVSFSDAEGPVPITEGSGPGIEGKGGAWTPNRPLHGTVTIHYRLPIENVPILSGGPPIQLRLDGDGFSGQGGFLIAHPEVTRPYRIAIRWDLSDMGPGAEGVSSFGDGDVHLAAGPVTRLDETVFMAGHLKRFPEKNAGAFSSVWLGQPSFEPVTAMAWTQKLHGWMSRFWKDDSEPPYRVFLRYNPMNAGGGAALFHSFIFTYKPGVTNESIKAILGHEMTHTWTAEETLGKWYDEGDAVYYQALLSWRAGLIDADQYLHDVNETASRYYTNPLNNVPDSEILPRFWGETQIRVLPYDRGAMYFAVLNGKIRRASHGKRSIDNLIQTMIDNRRAGKHNTEATWLGLLRKEIGEDGIAVHKSMLAGGLMLPESDDYGPCFRRTTKKIRRFDLGFDNSSVLGPVKIIKGLKPGSEAEKAGLREGDHFTYGVSLDAVQGDVTRLLTLQVTRDGKTTPVSYLPRGEAVDAYQWERIPGASVETCKGPLTH